MVLRESAQVGRPGLFDTSLIHIARRDGTDLDQFLIHCALNLSISL
jgi:hypothetical protein